MMTMLLAGVSWAGFSLASLSFAGSPLAGLWSTGHTLADGVDAVIALTVVECLALVAWHRVTGRGLAPREFVINLVSGLCLMLALHCAVRGAAAIFVVLALLGAGIAHVTDLVLRARRAAVRTETAAHPISSRDRRGSPRSLST